MYHHIEGTLSYKDPSTAVIDCGGVGYKLTVCAASSAALPAVGEKVKLFTHLLVREDALELLGFRDTAERSAFLLLLTVSGVGPKVAMSVLSALGADRFAYAVVSGNYKDIALAHGVSAKTAQKIILELRDKISASAEAPEAAASAPVGEGGARGVREDAASALIVLGYSRAEALRALEGADLTLPLGQIIKEALKRLAK